MSEWRVGRGWSEAELEERLERLEHLPRNFDDSPDQMRPERGWRQYYSEAVVARERPGPPEEKGPFAQGRKVVASYQFSDPRIVIGHFDPEAPLLGRRMLLEMRALRLLHYVSGVVVGDVQDEAEEGQTVFGFRYDTLEGHLEEGIEWFCLSKEHETGKIRFRIEACWRPGQFPNWWSRLGFLVLGPLYQRVWHNRAHRLLARLIQQPVRPHAEPEQGRLMHTNPEVVFKRIEGTL